VGGDEPAVQALPVGFDGVFLLLLLADFWRERTLDTIPGYFMLRTSLTVGVLIAIGWRLLLMMSPAPD
jgi:hypothetical protein